jgi:hypothetical protein
MPLPKKQEAATRSYTKDFLGGIDPFGTWTTGYGVADANASEAEAARRRRIATLGGVVGGASVVPSAIYGLIGAGQNIRGGPRAALLGGLAGAAGFYRDIYRGLRGSRSLGRVREGKKITVPEVKNLTSLAKGQTGMSPTVRGFTASPTQTRTALENLPAEQLVELQEKARRPAETGLMSLGLSGAIGGTAANVGYDKGRSLGKAMTPEGRVRVTKGVKPGELKSPEPATKSPKVASAYYQDLMKFAAEVDPAALEKFYAGLQPGDVINFQAQGADVARKGVRKGLMHGLVSAPIQKATGSPEHHTAIYVGTDPKTGKPQIVHNYEQAGKKGVQVASLEDFADTTQFRAYRPAGVTPEQAEAAAQEARALAESGATRYSKRNLAAAGLQQLSEKTERPLLRRGFSGAASRVGEVCDPGTGICSTLPADAYSKSLGKGKAVETFAGKAIPAERAHFSVTPGSIRTSPHLTRVGEYAPAKPEASAVRAGATRAAELAGESRAGSRVKTFLSSLRKMPAMRFA